VACERGIRTRFFTAAQLVVRLSEAYAGGTMEKTLATILKAELLILDEWGYVPIDKHGAQLLFRIISDSYEMRSLIITTNTEFSQWGSIFADDQMAAAMIDRGLPRAHPAVRRRELPDEARPHAAKALGKRTRGLMAIFGRSFRVLSLDETQASWPFFPCGDE
jgi:hypothetical protein